MTEPLYKEFRKDGWPFCPVCGEDELWSNYIPPFFDKVTEEERQQKYIQNIVGCYKCHWRRPENNKLLDNLDRLIESVREI